MCDFSDDLDSILGLDLDHETVTLPVPPAQQSDLSRVTATAKTRILELLKREGGQTTGDLAYYLGLPKASVRRTVNELRAAGDVRLLTRYSDGNYVELRSEQ